MIQNVREIPTAETVFTVLTMYKPTRTFILDVANSYRIRNINDKTHHQFQLGCIPDKQYTTMYVVTQIPLKHQANFELEPELQIELSLHNEDMPKPSKIKMLEQSSQTMQKEVRN